MLLPQANLGARAVELVEKRPSCVCARAPSRSQPRARLAPATRATTPEPLEAGSVPCAPRPHSAVLLCRTSRIHSPGPRSCAAALAPAPPLHTHLRTHALKHQRTHALAVAHARASARLLTASKRETCTSIGCLSMA
eukprot:6198407-Pleurochrysis_carterae.AAC.1